MRTTFATVDAYLASLPDDRRSAIETVRANLRKSMPKGIEEGIQYGMIGYYVPHSLYPNGYHCDPKEPLPFISLASQKSHMAIYMFCLYLQSDWKEQFVAEYSASPEHIASGKKLDMGASCVRFKKLEDLPLRVIGQAIKRIKLKDFIAAYESSIGPRNAPKRKK
ncbi:MAG: DUF1801 domain-containing protein [Planctomycetes bacterium]|nr:DUF1801 domain-containing protein [Planctomycetota bacterium]